MSPSHEREQALFILAAAKPVAERAAFLDRECGADKALRARLEALLAAHDQPEPIMDAPVGRVKATMKLEFSDPPDETIGQKIGRYKILEKVGEGGCGVVYVAEQTEPVRRRVALKVIKLGMDTRQVVARFEAERQALAMMDHPNIAKVLDAGSTETGRPYFVMELVRGIRITDYCDQNNLSTKDRLDLFIKVCQAIQHAHQKGIIHRDIKPSNILVTLHDGVPVPKVIDFGIAKATEGRLTDATVYTQLHQFIGTPAYMSPEQAEMSGLDIDTRSDIYSLGVLLYELLTGRTPFDAKDLMSLGIDAMRKTIREQDPVRPSTKLGTLQGDELTTTARRRSVDSSRLAKLLRGDLDWIVMKCLEKDRTRRYETTNGLARDLGRYLNNEAVTARPPSSAYRFQKLVRRNKLAFAATGAVAAALLLGFVISAWQAVRATHATRDALAERQKAVEAQVGEKVQRQKAEALAVENEKNYQNARQNLYAADMAEAYRAVEATNFARVRQLLDGQRPKPGEKDLRGFEWRYLWAASRGDQVATLEPGAFVNAVDVSSDGKLIAAAFSDGTAKLWDSASLRPIACLGNPVRPAEESAGSAVAFSPDGRLLASSDDRRVWLWDTATHRMLKEISAQRPFQLAFSPDGRFLAVGTADSRGTSTTAGLTSLYDASTGEEMAVLPESGGHAIAFSRDGEWLATGPWHGVTKIWDVPSRRVVQSLPTSAVFSLCFSADHGSLFTVDGVNGVSLWNLVTGNLEKTLSTAEDLDEVKLSPDGKLLACGFRSGRIELWNTVEGKLLGTLHGHQSNVRSLAFTPDSAVLISGALDKTVRIWNTIFASTTPSQSPSVQVVEPFEFGPLCRFSSDGKWLATHTGAGDQSRLLIVDIEQRRVHASLASLALPVGFLPSGQTLVAFDISQTAVAGRAMMSPRVGPAPGKATPGRVEIWDCVALTNRVIPMRNIPSDGVTAFALSPDGTQLVMTLASPDRPRRTLYSADVSTGESVRHDLALTATTIGGLAFSPNGRYLAVGNGQKTLLCHWPEVTNFIELTGHQTTVKKPVFSPDGSQLVTGDNAGEVRVWEVPSGKLLFVLADQGKTVTSASFSADNLSLASSAGSTARLWHLLTRRELMSFDDTHSIEFSPDGKVMARIGIRANSKWNDYPLYLALLPTLAEIDNPPPQQPLSKLMEAAQRPAGVFEAVMPEALDPEHLDTLKPISK